MAVTRIKNNQITDSTITAAKIASGTLTGGLFAADITLASNVTITGNLTVSGSSDIISATNTFVNDPLVVFNNGFVAAPSYDIGILINRNLSAIAPYGSVNAAWIWKEADDAFSGLMTTETGGTTGAIDNSGFANLKIGNVTANSLTLTTGTFSASNGITGTPISGSTGHFTVLQGTAFSTGNAVISGGYINGLANLTATRTQTTNFSTGNAVISGGYISSLSNITTTTGNAATWYATTLNATSGNIGTLVATNFSSGNIYFTGTTAGTVATANVSLYNAVTPLGALTPSQAFYLKFGNISTDGNTINAVSANLSFNPNTNVLSATTFSGSGASLTNLPATAVAGTVTTANVSLYQQLTSTSINANLSVPLHDKSTGNAVSLTSTNIVYNPSTNTLFVGTIVTNGGTIGSTGSATSFTTLQVNNFSTGNAVISGGYISSLSNITTTTGNTATWYATTLNATSGNIGTLVATNFSSGNIYFTGTTAGTVSTANVSLYDSIIPLGALTPSQAFYLKFGNISTSGNTINAVSANLSFNPNTNVLSATTFSGSGASLTNLPATAVVGTVTTANVSLYQKLLSTNINANLSVPLYDVATGNAQAYTSANITYNPSTNTIYIGQIVTNGGTIGSTGGYGNATVFSLLQAINFSTANAVILGGYISSLSNITTTTGNAATWYATTINATSGNIGTLFATNFSSGNIYFTGTTAGTVSTANVSLYDAVTPLGALTPSQSFYLKFGNLSTSGNTINAVSANLSFNPNTGVLSANVFNGAQYGSIAQFTNFSTANAVISGGSINATTVGATTKASGGFTTLTATGVTTLTNGTAATSTSSGALQVTGGIGVLGNVWIGGNLYVANIVATSQSVLTVQDPLLYLTANNIYPYNYDIGFFSQFQGGSGNIYQHSGVVRSQSNTYWGFFSNVASEPGGTINWNDGGLIWDPIKAGDLELANTTASTSTTTGVLKVSGGAGIAGNVNAGNVSVSMTTGTVMGNVGNFNNLYGTFYGTIAGASALTANVSSYQALTNTTTNQTFYFPMYDKATGSAAAFTNTNVNVNPATGTISANLFSGAHYGTIAQFTNFSTGNAVISGGYISSLANITTTTGNAATWYATTINATNGNIVTLQSNNFSSGNIYFTGTTAGTVATANVSLYNAVTPLGALTPSQAFYLKFGNISTSGNTINAVSANLSFNPNTNVLSATTFSGSGASLTNLPATAVAGTVATANVSLYQQLTSTSINANLSVPLHDKSTGNAATLTSGNIVYNPFTNTIYIGQIVTNGGTIGSTGGYGNATVFSLLQAINFSTANAVISGGYISSLANITTTTGNAASWYATTLNATNGNIVTLQANNFSSGNVYFTGTTAGTVSTANVALYDNVTALGLLTPSQTLYLKFGNLSTSGNTINAVSANLSFNPNTGVLRANVFSGNVTSSNVYFTGITSGTVSTANVAISNQTVTSSVNATFYPGFYNILGGNAVPFVNSALNYNPSTGTLAATIFSGSGASLTNLPATGIVGTVSTANVALYAAVTPLGALTPSQAFYLKFGNISTTGNTIDAVSANLSYNPATGVLASNVFSGVGTFTTANTSSIFTASGNIVAASNTDSTSTTTGALVLPNGGVGIFGNVTAGKAATFNSSKTAGMDFVVRGKTDNTLIWARPGASYDQVVIGNSATTSTLVTGAKLIVNTTDSIMIPVGTTAQRPSSTGGTDTVGMIRYNSTSGSLEFYNGSSWQTAGSAFTVVTDTQFNGDGTTVAFTSVNFASATTNGIIVSINGIVQIPSLAYSLTGSTITFTEAPASGDVIDVRVLTTTTTITTIASANGYMVVSADNSGVYISTGTASATVFNWFDTTGGFVSNIANVSVASANTLTTVDTISNSVYRSAKYVIQVTNGASYQVSEALVIQNGTTATVAEYGVVRTGSNLGVISATVSGGSTLVQFIATNATNNVRIRKEYMVI